MLQVNRPMCVTSSYRISFRQPLSSCGLDYTFILMGATIIVSEHPSYKEVLLRIVQYLMILPYLGHYPCRYYIATIAWLLNL